MSEIKPPFFTWNMKKWRTDHGLNTPEGTAYSIAVLFEEIAIMATSLIAGYIIGKGGF